jgi:hypothetical protein
MRPTITAPLSRLPDWAIRLIAFLTWPGMWLLIPFARVVREYEFEV